MKRIIICVLSLILALTSLFGIACDNSPTNTESKEKIAYLYEPIAFENGVEFSVVGFDWKREIKAGFSTYTTEDIYLLLKVKVKNGSNEEYSAKSTDIWLLYGETKLKQVDIVFVLDDGFCSISQSATTTKTYYTCFELAHGILLDDLVLVIDNGEWLGNEQVKIIPKER